MGAAYARMKPAWKKRWLKTLRTPPDEGGYLQTTGHLTKRLHNSADAFCCLGVLKNLLVEDGHGAWTDLVDPGAPHRSYVYEDAGELSDKDMTLVGLTQRSMERLIILNDDSFYTFDEIADWVEEHL